MAKYERVPLEWLIQKKEYLKPLWDKFSVPQQTFIKAAYGLKLTTPDEHRAWAILNQACEYDELGYVTSWQPVPYQAQEYQEIVGLIGRRAGKSFMTCFMALYEAMFGGHLEEVEHGQDLVIPYVAQDLATAKSNMRYIAGLALQVPKLAAEIDKDTRERIQFNNSTIVKPLAPTVSTGRGMAIPVVIMDEVGFWYKTSDAANPDFEVQRALNFSQSQFSHFKQFIISTPYTEEGLLWEYSLAGTRGQLLSDPQDRQEYKNTIVMRASTASMENPRIHKLGRKQMEKLKAKDDETVFQRESLALFVKSESNYIPGSLIDINTDRGVHARTRDEVEQGRFRPLYVAVMDPAFRHDDFAFSIFHQDSKGRIIQDFLHVWSPNPKIGYQLDPTVIMAQIGVWLREWGIPVVYSDQYQLEALNQLAQQLGFAIVGHDFTGRSKAKIYGSLEQLLKTRMIKLLDRSEIRSQLSQLNKVHTALNNVQIAAPKGKKDDVATVVALGAHIGLQYYPMIKLEEAPKTLFQHDVARINRAKAKDRRWGDWT